jgi:exopolyphosphatase/guanosine-5'-triphosphate,3'-diphosphate pyrophosphatase
VDIADVFSPGSAAEGSGRGLWQRPVPFHRQAYAAIDLGTNNCRLLIARPSGAHFVVIDAFSRVVRLGEGLAQSGRLSDAAMDRALAALHVCAEKLKKRNVHLARSVATEACRRASNGAEFIERVHRETGIRLNIITAQEEARLAVLGCHILLERGDGPAMIFDIGGGSTEFIFGDATGAISYRHSFDVGSVRMTERFIKTDPPAEAELAAMEKFLRETFAPLPKAAAGFRFVGVAGTLTTICAVAKKIDPYDATLVHGAELTRAEIDATVSRLAHLPLPLRRTLPGLQPKRADVIVSGGLILKIAVDCIAASSVTVSDRGLRWGLLADRFGKAS